MLTELRLTRLRAGVTLWDVAAETGVSTSVLSLVERRKRGLNDVRANALATALGMPIETLFELDGSLWWAKVERASDG